MTVAAKEKISTEVIADVTSIDKQKERPALSRAGKTQSLEQEKKPEKKAEDHQSAVARHLVQNSDCALAMTTHFVFFVFFCFVQVSS